MTDIAPPGDGSGLVYEMLWDCRHCGATKLLGLTHRHCPNCGAEQNANERYFPADHEKVAVQNHVYYGADRVCSYCQNYSSRNAKHCGTCGAPLDEGADARRRADQLHAEGSYSGETREHARREFAGMAAPQAALPKPKSKVGVVLGILAACGVVLLTLILVLVFWKRENAYQVTELSWKREIDVERFGPVTESKWCSEIPSQARITRRFREVRGHEKVEAGEDCAIRKVDNGDGTFSERRECKPRYKEEPVYADKCEYTIQKWARARTLTAKGDSRQAPPRWPDTTLARPGECEGCERLAARRETYTVRFTDAAGKQASCDFDANRWSTFGLGSKWSGKTSVVGNFLACDSLRPR